MTSETKPSYKAISKEQIDALQLYRIDHHGNRLAASMVPAISKEGRARYISADELRTMYDNAPSVVGEPVYQMLENSANSWYEVNVDYYNSNPYNHKKRTLYTTPQTNRVAELEAKLRECRAALNNLRSGMAEAKNTNIVDYIDVVLGALDD